MPVGANYGKQVNTYLPNDVYNGIVELCRAMGGIAPSAFIRAVVMQATENGTVNPLSSGEARLIALARSPNTKPIPFAGIKAQHEARVKKVVGELLDGILPTIQANAEAIIEKQEQEANALAAAAEPDLLMETYNQQTDDWDDYVPPTQGTATTEGSWFRQT